MVNSHIVLISAFSAVTMASRPLYQFKKIIYVGNKTVPLEDLTMKQQADGFCKLIPYVKVVRQKKCLPAYLSYFMCSGLCHTMQVPIFQIFRPVRKTENKCYLCAPSKTGNKDIYMLCKNETKYNVVKKRITVILGCSCKIQHCKESSP